jgi:hypothetical protein
MRIIQISKVLATTLILGLFIAAPVTMQNAVADTVTKTITVKDRNGALLAGALVAIGYENADSWSFTPTQTTNSSGQVIFTNLPMGDVHTELHVQPAIGNLLDAFGFLSKNQGSFNLNSSSSVEINLKATSVLVNLKRSTGAAAPINSWFVYQAASDKWNVHNLLREGQFGINLASSLSCDRDYGILWAYNDSATASNESMRTEYRLTGSNCPTPTFEIEAGITGSPVPKTDNVFQLSSYKRNFIYEILSPTLGSMSGLGNTYLQMCSFNAQGEEIGCVNPGGHIGDAGLPDGTYRVTANTNYSQYSSTQFTAIISDSGTTTSLKVGYPASGTDVTVSNGVAQFPLAGVNLSGTIFNSNGETLTLANNQGFDVALWKRDNADSSRWDWERSIWSSTSNYGFNISETGTFRIEVTPIGLNNFVKTTTDTITATSSSGIKLSRNGVSPAASLTQNITLSVPNVAFDVINPLNSESLTGGWVTVEKIISSDRRTWVGNLDIYFDFPGRAAGSLADGTYLLTVNPPQGNQSIAGLATKQYTLVVSSSGTSFVLRAGNTGSGTTIPVSSNGRYLVSPATANVLGVLLDPSGQPVTSGNSSWVNVCLQKKASDGVNWNWVTCSQTSSSGSFTFSVTEVGTYRVFVEPQGRSDIAASNLSQFVVDSGNLSSFTQNYGNITAAAPTLKVRVREVGSNSNVRYAGIEIRKNNQFVNWVNTLQAASVAVNLSSAGTYQFIVVPTDLTPNSTRKSYEVVATAGSSGAISAAVTGVSADSNGIITLNLGQAQIQGKVLQAPDTSTIGVANSWVTAVNKTTREEMWQYGANSQTDGSFSMSLPAGTYTIYARSPYDNTTYGNSDPIGDITVAANLTASISGSAQSAGLTTSSFNIHLKSPYWSGKVLPPSGNTGIANARACLSVIISGTQSWNCVNTNSEGNWAMSKPAGFTTFGNNDELQVAENQNAQYSLSSYRGGNAIRTVLNEGGSDTVTVRLLAPNFTVRVVYGESSTAAANMWVNLNVLNGGWLGGSTTDTNGYAKFFVASLTTGVSIRIDPSNNSDVSAVAATTTKQYQNESMTAYVVSSAFSDTITMSVPNIRGLVTDPSSANAASAYSWVELFNSTTNQWVDGDNTDSNGYFALSAPASGSYRIRVNPSRSGSTTSTSHSYDVTTASNGTISAFTDKVTNLAVAATAPYGNNSSGAYPLTLVTPSVVGKVLDATSTGVRDSWVIPIDSTNNQLWEIGSNSSSDGSFSMAVPDGSYTIQANVPWNTSSLSSSAGCSVTIASGAITTTAGGCVLSNRQLQLQLRSPNLTVRVTNAAGTAIANAHVGLGLGAWNAHAQTDSSGNAAIFVDPVAINTANNGKLTGAQNLWMWIDPPYGTTDVVRTQCYSLQSGTACATLPQVTPGSGTFATQTIVAAAPAPNTSIYVKRPDGSTSAGANAWVSLIAIIKDAGGAITAKNWIAGSQTDSNGKAVFNVADTSTVFAVQIEAPWNERNLYAGATFDSATVGLTFAQVNGQNFSLSAPNLTMAARNTGNTAQINSGWVGVETVDGSNVSTGWVGGYGLDQNGKVSLKLSADGRFKLTLNPGPGITGVATSCIVTTDGSAAVALVSGQCGSGTLSSTIVSLPLASGNVTGVVTQTADSSVKIVGAIVSAYHTGTTDAATQVVTSTDINGAYSLQLDPAINWDVTFTPVNTGSDVKRFNSKTLSNQDILPSGTTTVSTTLDVATNG